MVRIQKLRQPSKLSGTPLEPGKSLKLRGVIITNKNDFRVFVDKLDRKPWHPAKKSSARKTSAKRAA